MIFKKPSTQYVCVCSVHSLAQQAHEVAGRVGVKAEGRDDDVGGSVSPLLVVILHPVKHRVSHCGLCMDHLTWRDGKKREERKIIVIVVMVTILVLVLFH